MISSPQIFQDGTYHPICGHWFWDNNEGAKSYCKQLGFADGEIIEGADESYPLEEDGTIGMGIILVG